MGVNQNSSTELDYILNSTKHVSLLARPRSHSHREAIDHQNRVRQDETKQKHNKMQVKPRAKPTTIKIELTDN
jgi:hypothetical protein